MFAGLGGGAPAADGSGTEACTSRPGRERPPLRPSPRYRSALVGIAVHSARSLLVASLTLAVVLR